MRKVYIALLLCVLLPLGTKAQTPSISVSYLENSCLGATQKIYFNLNGEVKSDNQYKIQVRKSGDNNPILNEIPATLKDGKLEVNYSDSTLASSGYLQLRIVASSPKIESNWYGFQLYTKGIIELSSSDSDTINIGDELPIKFTINSSTQVRVTMNDSSRFDIYPYNQGPFYSYNNITTDKTKTFYIAHAENTCGAMRVGGQVSAVINPTSIRTIGISPFNICEDSEVKIAISTFGNALPTNAKFRVRFRENSSSSGTSPRLAEVNAELKGNFIVARFPKGFNLKFSTQFSAVVLVDNPKIVGSSGDVYLNANPYPSAEFVSQSSTINVGETMQVMLQFTGLPPFSADLGGGITATSNYGGQLYLNLQPEKTTSYSVKSFSTGCGQVTVASPQTLVATVRDGIFLVSEDSPQILCAGNIVKLKIKSNGNFTAATKYVVNATFSNNGKLSFGATRNGDFLEIAIPTGSMSYDQLNSLQVVSTNPSYTSPYSYNFKIQSIPTQTVSNDNTFIYDTPGSKSLNYNLTGEGPFTLVDQNDKIVTASGYNMYQYFYLSKTTDFKYKSISNACYSNTNMPTARVTLIESGTKTGVYLEPSEAAICNTDSVDISLLHTGTFAGDNVFNIQTSIDGSTFQTIRAVSKAGKYKIKLPASTYNSSYARIRIASTNPVLFSDSYEPSVQYLPSQISINPQSTAQQPTQYLKTENIQLYFNGSGGGYRSVTFSDGTSDQTVNFDPISFGSIKISPPVGKTTTYTLKSVTNLCGTVPTNVSTYIKVIPYRILVSENDFYNSKFCSGGLLSTNFGISEGDPGNATFAMEVSKDGNYDFSTWVTGVTGKAISATIPADFTPGIYQMRITSSDGSVSNVVRFTIGAAPTAKMSTTLAEPVLVNAGQSISLKLDLTGSAPWNVIYENNAKQSTSYSPDNRYLNPTESKEYSIKTVYNTCGYGTATGKVLVKVKPNLITSSTSYTVCEGGSFTVNYDLQGDADLTKDYITFELLDNMTQKIIKLDSTQKKNGSILLKIPGILSSNSYQIRSVIKSYALISQLNVGVTTKADVTISGNTTINSGESTRLYLRSNKGNTEAKYTLSDGTTGTLYANYTQYEINLAVKPTKTTVYTVTSVSNSCGEGKASGSATVEVNPASERSTSISFLNTNSFSGFCNGDTLNVTYNQRGVFTAGNVMTVQISDTTGKNFQSIVTLGNSSPIKAILPVNLFSGKKYRLRVSASDAGTSSSAYEFPIIPSQKAKARFASETVLYDGVSNPKIIVLLEGGSPWQYQYGTDTGGFIYRNTSNSADTITLYQASPNQYYKLFRVSNQCGTGTIESPATVRVEVVTGEPTVHAKIIVAPNPAQNEIFIKFDSGLPRTLNLFNQQGTRVITRSTSQQEENIDIRNLSPGIYILKIESKGQNAVYKIMKQ